MIVVRRQLADSRLDAPASVWICAEAQRRASSASLRMRLGGLRFLDPPLPGTEARRGVEVHDDGVGFVPVAVLTQFVQIGLQLRIRLVFRESNLEQRPPGTVYQHATHRS